MKNSKHRGHEIIFVNGLWKYKDTNELVYKNKDRSCGYCGEGNSEKGHDSCIKNLPGVENACCGHGRVEGAYLVLEGGKRFEGKEAVEVMQMLKEKGKENVYKNKR
jgi:hypothetical protein